MTDILIFKDLASISPSSHHRVTSDLDAFEVAQSGPLCTANISRPLTMTPIKFNGLSASMLRVDE